MMTTKMRLFQSTGLYRDVTPGEDLFAQARDLIGCELIEVVGRLPGRPAEVLLVDEEGMLKENPIANVQASLIARQPIAGNAILCPRSLLR